MSEGLVERVAESIADAAWDSTNIVPLDHADSMVLARAAIAATLPDGWVAVPVEATEAMVDRFVSRALCVSVHGDGGWSNYAREQWATMITAAPSPERGEGR